jgi:hypothetical protein
MVLQTHIVATSTIRNLRGQLGSIATLQDAKPASAAGVYPLGNVEGSPNSSIGKFASLGDRCHIYNARLQVITPLSIEPSGAGCLES